MSIDLEILHEAIRYVEHGPAVTAQRAKARAAQMIRELRRLGYRVEPMLSPSSAPA